MSMMQEKMYMDVDDVCAILGVSKTYAYSLMREYNKELKATLVVAIGAGLGVWGVVNLLERHYFRHGHTDQ